MEIKIRNIGPNLCLVHFCYPWKEVQKLARQLKKDTSIDIDDEFSYSILYNYIECNELEKELLDREIVSIGNKEVHYLSPYSENKPIIGVAKFATCDPKINVSLPTSIPKIVDDKIKSFFKDINDDFIEALLLANLYYLEENNEVNETSIVSYELLYTKNGKVFNKITDQSFDVMKDEDLDKSSFIGAHLGDRIIVDEQDITIEALITKIENKIPYTALKNDIKVLNEMGYSSFLDLHERFVVAYKKVYSIDTYIRYFMEFAIETMEEDFTSDVIDFYKSKDDILYYFEYTSADDEEEALSYIKKSIIFDYFTRLIKTETIGSESYDDSIMEAYFTLEDYYFDERIPVNEEMLFATKTKLIDYLVENKLVKGIKKY